MQINRILLTAAFLFLLIDSPASAQYTSQVSIDQQNGVTIDGATFTNPSGYCLVITNSTNITVTNSTFSNCLQDAILVGNVSSNITVTHNTFEHVRTGFIAAPSSGTGYVFSYNRCLNMDGPFVRGQCVQFNGVNGAGNRVQHNYSIAFRNSTSRPEDHINMYNSGGTVDDYMQITNNYIEGGGPSQSGGGIVVGDNGGSYINIANNKAVMSGSTGFSIAGGSYIILDSNTAYSPRTDVSHYGMIAWSSTGACDNITVTNNRAYWNSKHGYVNNYYLPTGGAEACTNRTYTNNTEDSSLAQRLTADTRSAASP